MQGCCQRQQGRRQPVHTSLKYMSLPSSFFKQVALLQVEPDQAAVRDELAHDPEDARREGRATFGLTPQISAAISTHRLMEKPRPSACASPRVM